MTRRLTPHPATPCAAVSRLEATAVRTGETRLTLRYRLTGDLDAIRWPARVKPKRADELWKHTCFEAFIQPAGGEAYVELNLAPSTKWAAYRFDGYRAGMAPADAAPQIAIERGGEDFELRAIVDGLPAGDWHVGLTAVVEGADGAMSYWSLAHPQGQPDFHHSDCFCLEIPGNPDA